MGICNRDSPHRWRRVSIRMAQPICSCIGWRVRSIDRRLRFMRPTKLMHDVRFQNSMLNTPLRRMQQLCLTFITLGQERTNDLRRESLHIAGRRGWTGSNHLITRDGGSDRSRGEEDRIGQRWSSGCRVPLCHCEEYISRS